MRDDELLRLLDTYVDETRRELTTAPGYSDWQMGFVSGMYRVLRRAHEVVEAQTRLQVSPEGRDGIEPVTKEDNRSPASKALKPPPRVVEHTV